MRSSPGLAMGALLAASLLAWALVGTAPSAAPSPLPDPPGLAPAARAASAEVPSQPPEGAGSSAAAAEVPASDETVVPPAAPPAAAVEPEAEPAVPDPAEILDRAWRIQDEQSERNRQRFDAAVQRFAGEQRDPGWADGEEARMGSLVQGAQLADLVGAVECRDSLCRLELQVNSPKPSTDVMRLARLMRHLGGDRALRHESREGQNVVVVFTSREGHPLQPQGQDEPL